MRCDTAPLAGSTFGRHAHTAGRPRGPERAVGSPGAAVLVHSGAAVSRLGLLCDGKGAAAVNGPSARHAVPRLPAQQRMQVDEVPKSLKLHSRPA